MVSDLMDIFNSLPDKTFNFEAVPDPSKEDNVVVICTKKIASKLYNLFDEIKVRLKASGERSIEFNREKIILSDTTVIIKLINEVYQIFGKDEKGNTFLTSDKIKDLQKPLIEDIYAGIYLRWPDKKVFISAWMNSHFGITFSEIDSSKKNEILKQYFEPYSIKEINGLLCSRKEILDRTTAKIISDEFSKSKIIGIRQVAGVEGDVYIRTYSENDKNILERTELGISFVYSGGYFLISFICTDKLFHLNVGDTIILLFENEEIFEVTFNLPPGVVTDKIHTNNAIIKNEIISLFLNQSVKKWKLIQGNAAYKIGGFSQTYLSKHYKSTLEAQYLIQLSLRKIIITAIAEDAKSFDVATMTLLLNHKPEQRQDSIASAVTTKISEETLENALKELNDLIGLKEVKKEVFTLTNFIKIQKAREQAGLKSSSLSYHVVFTGNPGTGKTTVARILAKIYKLLGVLKKGQLVETDRSGLIGEYLGQTAPKVNKIVDSAVDGILFIDEAYSIVASKTDDYGKEAVATLIKRVEDDRSRLAVVMAGYNTEMKEFINSNSGFSSRFNRYINFADYTVDEMIQIFQSMCIQNEYQLEDNAKIQLRKVIETACVNRDKTFGNGRYVRNLFEKSLENQSNRIALQSNFDKETLTTITAADIVL